MEHCEFPIIGAIRGHAINAGFELALACDMLLCAPCAQFRDTHVALGLVPSWGLSSKLSLIVGPGAAKRAHFACRPIGADEARRVGLVLDVIDEPAGIEPGSAGSQGGDASSQRVTSHTNSSAQLGTNKFADDALMAAALALALEMTKNQKESVARIKNRIVDGYSLSFGESRTLERRVAFAQYRALPPAFFKKMKAAAGLKPSAKL
jgi:enoyl-CoA hydratase